MNRFEVAVLPFKPGECSTAGELSTVANPVPLYECLCLGTPVDRSPMSQLTTIEDALVTAEKNPREAGHAPGGGVPPAKPSA